LDYLNIQVREIAGSKEFYLQGSLKKRVSGVLYTLLAKERFADVEI